MILSVSDIFNFSRNFTYFSAYQRRAPVAISSRYPRTAGEIWIRSLANDPVRKVGSPISIRNYFHVWDCWNSFVSCTNSPRTDCITSTGTLFSQMPNVLVCLSSAVTAFCTAVTWLYTYEVHVRRICKESSQNASHRRDSMSIIMQTACTAAWGSNLILTWVYLEGL